MAMPRSETVITMSKHPFDAGCHFLWVVLRIELSDVDVCQFVDRIAGHRRIDVVGMQQSALQVHQPAAVAGVLNHPFVLF